MINSVKFLFKIDEYYSNDFTIMHVDLPVISGFEQACSYRMQSSKTRLKHIQLLVFVKVIMELIM